MTFTPTTRPPDGPAPDPDSGILLRPVLRGWLHAGAFVAALVAGPLLISHAKTSWTAAALTVYVISIVALYGVSAGFHRIRWSLRGRRRMRRADHSTIFIAIAGSYTAVAALSLKGWAEILVLALVWGGAIGGITLRQLWLDAPKWAVALPYVVVGWSALFVLPQLYRGIGGAGFTLILIGGLFYTAGAVVYALKKPNPYPRVFGYHEIFHACTVVGGVMHFIAIAAYALPRS
jgi:hemolysin III